MSLKNAAGGSPGSVDGVIAPLAGALLALILAGCAVPDERPAPERKRPPINVPAEERAESRLPPYRRAPGEVPQTAEDISGPAVMSLLTQARTELNQGRAEQAVAALERAQRIEPRNPFVWQQLARTHLQQYRMQEAEHMAQRSNSLARGNPYVEIENWRIIGVARQAAGDVAGVEEAQARLAQIQDAL